MSLRRGRKERATTSLGYNTPRHRESFESAGGGNRTRTLLAEPRILSPVRLPVSPPRRRLFYPISGPPPLPSARLKDPATPISTMIERRLGHYEITAHLGSGGMGDVYQATDTRLGRSVALKFIPEAFAHNAERVARFGREAKALASPSRPQAGQRQDHAGRASQGARLRPGKTGAAGRRQLAYPRELTLRMHERTYAVNTRTVMQVNPEPTGWL